MLSRNKSAVKKVVLIQPPDPKGKIVIRDHMGRFGIMDDKVSVARNDVFPPLDLAYSAALLEKNGFEVRIIDAPVMNYTRARLLKEVKQFDPDMIIVNTAGVTIAYDLETAARLKSALRTETTVITPTFIDEEAIKKSKIGLFIRGESEYTVLELCQKYPNVKKIRGMFFRKGRKLVYNPKRPLIQDLDALPFPAYHLLPLKKYSNHMFKGRVFTTAMTSRGCPFGCIYCLYPLGMGHIWRGRTAQNVVRELKMLHEEFGVEAVLLRDQVFNFNQKRAEEICDGIIREGIKIKWRCEARVDLFSKRLLRKMKQAGCDGIHLGIESGDINVLNSVAKGCTTSKYLEITKRVFRQAKEVGLETLAFFMVGFPGETKESIEKTFKLAREIKADQAWFTGMVPYPGTELYKMAERKGWLLTKNYKEYTGRGAVMRTDHLSAEDIKKAVEAGNAMFSKSNVKFLQLAMSPQGIKSALLDPKRALRIVVGRFSNRGKW